MQGWSVPMSSRPQPLSAPKDFSPVSILHSGLSLLHSPQLNVQGSSGVSASHRNSNCPLSLHQWPHCFKLQHQNFSREHSIYSSFCTSQPLFSAPGHRCQHSTRCQSQQPSWNLLTAFTVVALPPTRDPLLGHDTLLGLFWVSLPFPWVSPAFSVQLFKGEVSWGVCPAVCLHTAHSLSHPSPHISRTLSRVPSSASLPHTLAQICDVTVYALQI